MPSWLTLMFQDSMSPLMEQLTFFHDHVLMIIIMIMSLVSYLLFMLLSNSFINRFLLDNQELEALWTSFPGIILIFIALPSLHLLYMMDEVNSPSITLKAIGHQWYWSYEYSDFKEINFDSFMISTENKINSFRLLDTDNRIILPTKTQIRLLVTSADVIHSWAVPSLGCKIDAVPGRLNQTSFMVIHPAVMFGQCSEICGANHSFMPIVVEAIPANKFIQWMNKS